jgi:hypothetical protein
MADAEKLRRLLSYDPYLDKSISVEKLNEIKKDNSANVIFARQDYQLKDGISLGLDREKYYLYISATDEFLSEADKKLKHEIPSIEKVDAALTDRIISELDKERSMSEHGLGMIFG